MNRKWKKMIVLCCTAVLTLAAPAAVMAQEESPAKSTVQSSLAASARSAILMDADSGTIIYEKNSHDQAAAGEHYEGYDDAAHHGSSR